MALHCSVNLSILDKIVSKLSFSWGSFSKEELKITIAHCNNSFIPGPDKLLWRHFKIILQDNTCLENIIKIANACIDLGYWLSHFKKLTTVIISKPNKRLRKSLEKDFSFKLP